MNGFLKKFKNGPNGEVVYAPHKDGFLRLLYEDDGCIYQCAFVKEHGAVPSKNQPQLYFVWVNNFVTFKSENSMGGRQWNGGSVYSGTTLEPDDDAPIPAEQTLTLDEWVDECIDEMSR